MARALTYLSQGRAALREVTEAEAGDVRVRTMWSGLSRGTERLVWNGAVPDSQHRIMRAPFQRGDFPFPVAYGYAAVGMVEAGPPDLLERPVFCLYPHQDRFSVPADAVLPLPDGLPPRRAVLAANMETALNGIWDSGAGPGDRIAIVGGGVLGFLLATLCERMAGTEVFLIDREASRAALADHVNVLFSLPTNAPGDCDVVFHTTATEAGAATALESAGVEATVVEMSWFGDRVPSLPLGEGFHSRRLRYVSSQVGQVAPSRRPRWTHRRRLAKALDLLRDDRLDALITGEVAFEALPEALPDLLAQDAPGLATAIRYEGA